MVSAYTHTNIHIYHARTRADSLICWYQTADLIAAMTWPINAIEELREAELSGDKATIEAIRKIDFSSLKEAQRSYKSAILKSNAIAALFKMLKPRLQRGFR